MRMPLFSLLTLLPLFAPGAAIAHVGDVIYPIFELLDEDLDRIDLTDGSVEDWLEVVGEPSLTAADFVWGYQGEFEYDPSEVDFRIWLAWHQGSSTLWIAMERFDDIYFNLYDGDKPFEMRLWDSSLRFYVDGDHTGGPFSYRLGWLCEDCTAEELLENNRQAQHWMVIAEAPDGENLYHHGASEWVARDPYAAAGGGVIGETPALTVTEVKVTLFDDLIYNDEDASRASQLYPGKTIGFQITTRDNDDTQWDDGYGESLFLTLALPWSITNADFFVDGLLLGAGEDPSRYDDVSAVEPSSWARIKASFK